MTLEFSELPFDPFDGYYGIQKEAKPQRVTHLLAIEIEETNYGEHSILVESVIRSFLNDLQQMRELLKSVDVKVHDRYQASAGRFQLDIHDHGKYYDLSTNHHLRTYPSEEGPGEGQWSEDWDWEVVHPEECSEEVRYDDLCPFINEVAYAGRDAFGEPSDWPDPPFCLRIKHVVEEHPAGPWGGAEYDTYVMLDEEDES